MIFCILWKEPEFVTNPGLFAAIPSITYTPYGSACPTKYEPRHDKTNKLSMRPASAQSDQSLRCALNAGSEDSDQTGRIPRQIWFVAGRTCHFVGFVILRLKTNWRMDRTGCGYKSFSTVFERRHEKTCFCHMRTTKAQINLRIRAVWSAPLLFAT